MASTSTATESSLIESPQMSYIIPSEDDSSHHHTIIQRALCQTSHSFSSSKSIWRALRPAVYLLLILLLILIVGLLSGWWNFRSNNGGWDRIKMELLQPVLLYRVKALMATANRSIHDQEARQFLRNLSRQESHTCLSPTCLHTSMTNLNFTTHIR
jgi:hypothetical protein